MFFREFIPVDQDGCLFPRQRLVVGTFKVPIIGQVVTAIEIKLGLF
jgi:hypothetical protein